MAFKCFLSLSSLSALRSPSRNPRRVRAGGDSFTEYRSKRNIAIIVVSVTKLRIQPPIVALSMSLTPFLTVVVSGLYAAQRVVINGVLVDPARYRLHQSAVSTRILDALLGRIFPCLGLSWYLMPVRKKDEILPKNPYIAATASLIAGAKMLEEVPAGAEWRNDGGYFVAQLS